MEPITLGWIVCGLSWAFLVKVVGAPAVYVLLKGNPVQKKRFEHEEDYYNL